MARRRQVTSEHLERKRGELVVRLLYFAFQRFRGPLFARLEERGHRGIGLAHSLVLRNLDLEGTALAEIVRRAGTSRQAVAKVARELEEMGYVRLRDDPADGRAKQVRLTARGRVLVGDVLDVASGIDAEMVDILGPRRFRDLQRSLQDLCAAAEVPGRPGSG